MYIETTNFGRIEIEATKTIKFEEKILGFEGFSQFSIINSQTDHSFFWLQSLEKSDLAFIMINPAQYIEGYQVELTEEISMKLELNDRAELLIYSLVVIGQEGSYISTNLKAPLLINSSNNKAGQFVLEQDYPTRHYLFKKGNAV